MSLNDKIYVAGHRGMVGSSIVRELNRKGYDNLIFRTHKELDLTRQCDVETFFKEEQPDAVFLAAAKVGGITAKLNNPVDYLMDNIIIYHNIIKSAYENNIDKLVFLGSSCIYPLNAKQPLKEEYLLTDTLEPANEGYALSKIIGLKACEYYNQQYGTNFISVMPPNIYGINDNFDLKNAHVVASLIRKMHEAKKNNQKQVEIWGTGKQYRELMFVDDVANATIFAFENYNDKSFINIGVGVDYTIRELAETIQEVVEFEGELYFDTTKPDGMFKRVLDANKFKQLGWAPKYTLKEGLELTYDWFLKNIEK